MLFAEIQSDVDNFFSIVSNELVTSLTVVLEFFELVLMNALFLLSHVISSISSKYYLIINNRFVINQSYDKLSYWMGHALIGIHTMWNEHFGISVVEMMAAGLVVIAHRSGGPLMDIILHDDSRTAGNVNSSHASTGYLCASAAEYAAAMSAALDNYDYSAGAASTTCTTVERRCGRGEKDGTGTVRRSMRDRARDSSRRFSDDSFKRGFLSVFIQACRLK